MQEPLIYLHVGQYHKTEQLCQSLKRRLEVVFLKEVGYNIEQLEVGVACCGSPDP